MPLHGGLVLTKCLHCDAEIASGDFCTSCYTALQKCRSCFKPKSVNTRMHLNCHECRSLSGSDINSIDDTLMTLMAKNPSKAEYLPTRAELYALVCKVRKKDKRLDTLKRIGDLVRNDFRMIEFDGRDIKGWIYDTIDGKDISEKLERAERANEWVEPPEIKKCPECNHDELAHRGNACAAIVKGEDAIYYCKCKRSFQNEAVSQ